MKTFFTAAELYILTEAAGYPALVGCPDVNHCQFSPRTSSEKALPLLKEKGLLEEKGRLTKEGFAVVRFIEAYCQHEHYIFINRCTMGFLNQEGIGLIREQEGYRFIQMSRQEWLEETYLRHPMLRGEVDPNHQKRRRMIRRKEKEALTQQNYKDHLAIGQITLKEGKIDSVKEWILFQKEEELIEIEVHTQEIYKISQGVLNRRVVDVIGVPYEVEKEGTVWEKGS